MTSESYSPSMTAKQKRLQRLCALEQKRREIVNRMNEIADEYDRLSHLNDVLNNTIVEVIVDEPEEVKE